MTTRGLWLARRRLVAVLVGPGGDARRPLRAASSDDARYGLVEYLAAAEAEIVVTEALARTDTLPRLAARRGLPLWTVDDGLIAALLGAAAIRDPARAAALLARLPRIPLLRVSLRRLTLPGAGLAAVRQGAARRRRSRPLLEMPRASSRCYRLPEAMYDLSALVGPRELLHAGSQHLRAASLVDLTPSLTMLPVTKELRAALGGHDSPPPLSQFEHLSASVRDLAVTISEEGRVAYIEAEYFGGTGGQAAVVFDHGQITVGPLAMTETRQATSSDPINTALRTLGVKAAQGLDEFDTVGLGRHRCTNDWCVLPE